MRSGNQVGLDAPLALDHGGDGKESPDQGDEGLGKVDRDGIHRQAPKFQAVDERGHRRSHPIGIGHTHSLQYGCCHAVVGLVAACGRGAQALGSRFHLRQPRTSAMPQTLNLAWIDYAILVLYFAFVLGIGWALKRHMKGSQEFFLSGRAIPAWVTGLAFLSANLGAQEVIGMAASGAKYGIMTSHFYWVGAIPAMVFLAIFMMPFYYGSRARSVPEYLKLRFDEKTRAFNAISFAVMTVFSSGISLHALAQHAFGSSDTANALALFDLLLRSGARLDARTHAGQDALLVLLGARAQAGARSDAEHLQRLCGFLLERGARLDTQDQRGVSALHACALHGLYGCARLLKAHGAPLGLCDGFGRTAADVAVALGYVDVAAELGAERPPLPGVRQTLRRPARTSE